MGLVGSPRELIEKHLGPDRTLGEDINNVFPSLAESREPVPSKESRKYISGYGGPVVEAYAFQDSMMTYDHLSALFPNIKDNLEELKNKNISPDYAMRIMRGVIMDARASGVSDFDIQEKFGITPEALAMVKTDIKARKDDLYQELGIDENKMSRAFYYAEYFGIDDPQLVFRNFDEYDKKYNSIPKEDRAKRAKNPMIVAEQDAYEDWVKRNKLSTEQEEFINSIKTYAEKDKFYNVVMVPFFTNAFKMLDAIEGTITSRHQTEWNLMAEALETADENKLEWALKMVSGAGHSVASFVLVHAGIRAAMIGAGSLLGPIGMALGAALSLAVPVVLETLMDSREVYREVYKRTNNSDFAMRVARTHFFIEAPVTAATGKLGVFAERGGQTFLSRFWKSALAEGIQEAAQEDITTAFAHNVPFTDKEALKNALVAFAVSIPTAGLVGAVSTGRGRPDVSKDTTTTTTVETAPSSRLDVKTPLEIKSELDGHGTETITRLAEPALSEAYKGEVTKAQDITADVRQNLEFANEIEGLGATTVENIANKLSSKEYVKAVQKDLDDLGLDIAVDSKRLKQEAMNYLTSPEKMNPVFRKIFDLQIFGSKKSPFENFTIAEIRQIEKTRARSNALKAIQKQRDEAIKLGEKDKVKELDNKIKKMFDQLLALKRIDKLRSTINKNTTAISKMTRENVKATLHPKVAIPLNEVLRGFKKIKSKAADATTKAKALDEAVQAMAKLKQFDRMTFAGVDEGKVMSAIKKAELDMLTFGELEEFSRFVVAAKKIGSNALKQVTGTVDIKAQKISEDTYKRIDVRFSRQIIETGLKNMLKKGGMKQKTLVEKVSQTTGEKVTFKDIVNAVMNPDASEKSKLVHEATKQALSMGEGVDLKGRAISYAKGPGKMSSVVKAYLNSTLNFMRLGEYLTGSNKSMLAELMGDSMIEANGQYNLEVNQRTRWFQNKVKEFFGNVSYLQKRVTIDGKTFTKNNLFSIYAYARQARGYEALTRDNGYSEAFIDKAISSLSTKDRQFVDMVVKDLEAQYDALAEAVLVRTGRLLSRENFYFRLARLAGKTALEGTSGEDFATQFLRVEGPARRSIEKQRTTDPEPKSALSLDFAGIWSTTIDQQARIKAFSEPIGLMRRIFNDNDLLNRIEAVHGKGSIEAINRYIDVALNPLTMYSHDAFARTIRTLRHAKALNVLVLNGVSILRQFPSITLALAHSNANGVARALNRFVADPIGTWKRINMMSPTVRFRTFNIVSREARSQIRHAESEVRRTIARLEYLSMSPQGFIDSVAVSLGWLSCYETALSKGMDEKSARMYADKVIVKTQPQGEAVYLNRMRTGKGFGGEIMRGILLFTNQLTQNFNVAINDIPNSIRDGDYGLAIKQASALAVSSAFIVALAGAIDDAAEFGQEFILNLIKMMPFIGKSIEMGAKSTYYGGTIPGTELFESTGTILKAAGEGDVAKMLEGLHKLIMTSAPIPAVAIKRGLKFSETGELADLIGYKK